MREQMKQKKNYMIFIGFSICMIVFGASDSLRGVFSVVFQEHYVLSTMDLSVIVTLSYVGNLVFLLCGGNLLDRFNKKHVFLITLAIWMLGAMFFIAGDSYGFLLMGMFLCTGASTLMNTTINIMVPTIFLAAPGLVVNVLFFIQGMGTSGVQNVVGRLATDISNWKLVNGVLLGVSLVGMLIMFTVHMPDTNKSVESQTKKKSVSYSKIIKNPAFFYYIAILGFYFIAEHGILNWFMVYGITGLGLENDKVAVLLSIFFGGITVGRLLFAPLVQKLSIQKSVLIFGGLGTVLYALGIAGGAQTVIVLSSAGLLLSIIYPTLILMIQNYYEKNCIASATGLIISVATLFDIGFNLAFAQIVDRVGMKNSFYVLQISMILFLCSLVLFKKNVKEQLKN